MQGIHSIVRAGLAAVIAGFPILAWTQAPAQTGAAVDHVVAALTSDHATRVKTVQQALAAAGLNPGPADGDWGAASWTALSQWRAANPDLALSKEATWELNHLVGVAPPEDGTPQTLLDGQHMVVPASGETRPFQWDAQAHAWKAPKDYAFASQSQGWVKLRIGPDTERLLVFYGARLSPDGQILLGEPIGSRRLTASLSSKDGKSLGKVGCRIGQAVLISDVVVPCGFAVSMAW